MWLLVCPQKILVLGKYTPPYVSMEEELYFNPQEQSGMFQLMK